MLTQEKRQQALAYLKAPKLLKRTNADIGKSIGNILYTSVSAFAGTAVEAGSFASEDNEFFAIPGVAGGGLVAFPIEGNSMEPVIQDGDMVICREISSLKEVKENELYAVKSNGTLWIKYVKLVYDQDTAIKLSHNIFIDTAVGKMYSCGGGNSKKFNVFSLSNPLDPKLILSCENDITWWPSTVGTGGYVHDAFARNDTVYCNAGNGLYVVDFSSTPTLLGNLSSYPDKGYNHSGWLSEDGKTYAMADETWGKKLKMVDVSDLTNIQFLDTVGISGDNNAIVHNPIIKGDYVYVAYYYDGVYIYDIKNPSNPLLVGYYDCSSELNFRSYKGAWGVYPFLSSGNLLVSDMQEGLFVFDVSTAVSGVAELKIKERFKLFPNPGRNEINLVGISNFDETYSLKIFDASGKQVHSQELKNNFLGTAKIELSNEIPKGIYVVTIFNGTFVQNIKYIKQ